MRRSVIRAVDIPFERSYNKSMSSRHDPQDRLTEQKFDREGRTGQLRRDIKLLDATVHRKKLFKCKTSPGLPSGLSIYVHVSRA